MRTVSDDLEASLFAETTTLCHLLVVTRQDGEVVRLTDSDVDVTYGGDLYDASIGFTCSAVNVSVSSKAAGVTVDVAMTEHGVTEQDVRDRKYERATVELMVVDWASPANGALKLYRGHAGRIEITDRDHATIDVIPFTDQSGAIATDTYSQSCRVDLGDSKCTVNIELLKASFTVVSVASPVEFVVDTLAGKADDYFAFGQLIWDTGANSALPLDVRSTVLSTKTVKLFYPPLFDVVAGDTGRIYAGCDKQAGTCKDKFNNILNFRGEPFPPQWFVTS